MSYLWHTGQWKSEIYKGLTVRKITNMHFSQFPIFQNFLVKDCFEVKVINSWYFHRRKVSSRRNFFIWEVVANFNISWNIAKKTGMLWFSPPFLAIFQEILKLSIIPKDKSFLLMITSFCKNIMNLWLLVQRDL